MATTTADLAATAAAGRIRSAGSGHADDEHCLVPAGSAAPPERPVEGGLGTGHRAATADSAHDGNGSVATSAAASYGGGVRPTAGWPRCSIQLVFCRVDAFSVVRGFLILGSLRC